MAFDAGTIIAHLDLEDSDFDRKLRRDVERIEAFERAEHEIKLRPEVDETASARARQQLERLDRQATQDAHRRGGMLSWMLGGRGGGGGGGDGGGGGLFRFLGGIAGAAGPGLNALLPIGARAGLIAGAGGIGLGALPALAAPLAVAGIGGIGAGVAALGAKTVIGTKQDPGQLYQPAQQALKRLQDMMKQAAQPIVAPLRQAFRQLPGLIRDITPVLRQLFAGAGTLIMPVLRGLRDLAVQVLPLLGKAFRAVAPLIQPLLGWLGQALGGILRGLIPLLRAAAPAVAALGQVLGMLGTGIGTMLRDFAPVIKDSAVILKALGGVLAAIFPIVGKLAQVFARALAPVVKELGQLLKALTPVFVIIGKLIADLAGAVLKDLVAIFKAVVDALIPILPLVAQFAREFGKVFDVLENAGVFGIIASAIEQLAGPFGRFVSDVLKALIPILPPVIKFLGQMAGLLARGLAQAVEQILPPLTNLVLHVLKALVPLLPVILPLLAQLAGIFVPIVAQVIADVATAFADMLAAIPPGVLQAIALGFLAIWAAIKVGGLIASVSNPVGLIAIAVGLLIVGIVELVKHWHTVWGAIKSAAAAAWNFLTHGWGQFLFPALYLIRKVVEFVRDHWKDAWDAIKGAGQAAWHFIHDNVVAPLANFFTDTIPAAFKTCVNWVRQRWDDITGLAKSAWHFLQNNIFNPWHDVLTKTIPDAFKSAVHWIGQRWDDLQNIVKKPVHFVVYTVLNGLISAFDWITSKVGLGKPIPKINIPGLARGGRLGGYGGGDILPALLEPGETVVSKEDSRQPFMRAAFTAAGVPGYQQGGLAGARANLPSLERASKRSGGWLGDLLHGIGGLAHKALDIGKITAAIFSGNTTALVNAITNLVGGAPVGGAGALGRILAGIPKLLIHEIAQWLIGKGGGVGGGPIVRFAESFIGKVPYVWGGDTPQGWDCSGFVEYIYNHFGIHPPRTAAAQWGWVRRTGSPVPGGLAFFSGADGSVSSPGHVGIVVGPNRMVDAFGTGFGTRFDAIRGSSGAVAGYGIPPGGLRGAGRGFAQRGSWTLPGLEGLWRSAGGPGGMIAHIAAAIALAESGGNPRVVNSIGASGLWQIYGQVVPGNILNPFVNAVNAVTKYQAAGGFRPWVTYMSGAYRQFMDRGGWMMPGRTYGNATGQPEAVLNPAQSDAFMQLAAATHALSRRGDGGTSGLERKLDQLIAAVERSADQTADGLAAVLNGTARKAVFSSAYSAR